MIYALIMTPAILTLIAYAPLPNGGGINYVLICLSTDNVTERLFQRALWTTSLGFYLETAKEQILKGSRLRYRKNWLPKWERPLRASAAPWTLSRTGSRCMCWRPSTGRTTATRGFGCFTLRGIILRKLAIKTWKNKCTCKFWEYYSCLSSRGSPNII